MNTWTQSEQVGDLTVETHYNRDMAHHVRGSTDLYNVKPAIRITVLNSRGSTVAEHVYTAPDGTLFADVSYAADGSVITGERLTAWLQDRIATLLERGRANRDWDIAQ